MTLTRRQAAAAAAAAAVEAPLQQQQQHKHAAINGLTVPELRRGTDAVRRAAKDDTLVLTDEFMFGMTPIEFCTKLLVGQYEKRRLKRERAKQTK